MRKFGYGLTPFVLPLVLEALKMFSVNDTVRYGITGVCKIADITTRPFQGQNVEYYVLQPVHDPRSTLYVPVGNNALADKMYTVLSRDEVMELITSMPRLEEMWINDDQERKRKYREILMSQDRESAVCVIKALYAHNQQLKDQGKKLRLDDERCLREAERLLYDEFALVLQLLPEQVLPFIKEQLAG